MGISEMTHMSYFFVIMAVLFGIITVIMYFALDIRRCWRIVQGKHSVIVREKAPCVADSNTAHRKGSDIGDKTEKLEETVLLETMTLVQDIVMMDAGNCVNP